MCIDQEKLHMYVGEFYHKQTDRQTAEEGMSIIAQRAALKKLPARSQFIFNKRFTGELVQSGESVVEES